MRSERPITLPIDRTPLATHNWAAFARGYNGADYAKNQYDAHLAAAYGKFSQGFLPDLLVRQAQVLLTFLKLDPGGIDGVPGKQTRSAVVRFRESAGLGNSDVIDAALIAAMQAKIAA